MSKARLVTQTVELVLLVRKHQTVPMVAPEWVHLVVTARSPASRR
jgi:hypothetical protein